MSQSFEVIQPFGTVDLAQANHLRDRVSQIIATGTSIVLVDLKDVGFMDSSGLAGLVVALKMLNAANGRLCLCSINDQIKLLFELTSMTHVFEIFSDRNAFLQALTTPEQTSELQ